MTKRSAAAIIAGLLVTILLWVAALSNGLGSNGAAAANAATRSTPVAQIAHATAAAPQTPNTSETQPTVPMPGGSVSVPGTSDPADSTGSNVSHETEIVVGFGDGAGGDD